MRILLSIAPLLTLTLTATSLHAQRDCGATFRGTKTLYRTLDTAAIASPKGYEPVFINFVGRHGARHPTSLKDLQLVRHTLMRADSAHALSAQGTQLLRMTNSWLQVESGFTQGGLSERGIEELAGIGRRMMQHYPMLNSADRIAVRTTVQQRTRQSAKAFFKGMEKTYPEAGSPDLADNDSVRLRFYDIAPAYLHFKKNGAWKPLAAKLSADAQTKRMLKGIVEKLFIPGYANEWLRQQPDDAIDFAVSIYSTAAIEPAIAQEIQAAHFSLDSLDITRLFSCDELQWLEVLNDAEDFLIKGPGMNASGIQVKIAAPLLADFIRTTDSALQKGITGAVLRFAHAETIAPFAVLMGVQGAATPSADIQHFNKVWATAMVIPFASNIQWIFYRDKRKTGEDLVMILMNEAPVRIPVATKSFPYYQWSAVRKYYLQKLVAMGAGAGSDMYQFLLHVQE